MMKVNLDYETYDGENIFIIPTCPKCNEPTYSEPKCPFCNCDLDMEENFITIVGKNQDIVIERLKGKIINNTINFKDLGDKDK